MTLKRVDLLEPLRKPLPEGWALSADNRKSERTP